MFFHNICEPPSFLFFVSAYFKIEARLLCFPQPIYDAFFLQLL